MAKTTILILFILAVIATLLFGINIGKKIGKSELSSSQSTLQQGSGQAIINYQLSITPTNPTPALIPTSTATPSATTTKITKNLTTYTDKICGFTFSYPGSFIKEKTVNAQSVIFTDPDNPDEAIATTCAEEIPKPPLPPDKIEKITLDEIPATLYHDANQKDGSPRDEVIVKHPTNGLEIIIAGYGPSFQQIIKSLRFLE